MSSAVRAGEMCIADLIERARRLARAAGACSGMVEAQRVDDRLAVINVVSQVELTERRLGEGDRADPDVARVDVQSVRDVADEH